MLLDLISHGVILTRNGDKPKIQAVPGALTEADRANLASYKLALLSILDPDLPVTFAPMTLNEIADGILDWMGFEVERVDNDLHGEPWSPTIYVKPI